MPALNWKKFKISSFRKRGEDVDFKSTYVRRKDKHSSEREEGVKFEEDMHAMPDWKDVNEELNSVNADLEERNRIIEEMRKQLDEKQTMLMEKTCMTEKLRVDLKEKERELEVAAEELRMTKLRLEENQREIDGLKKDLDDRLKDLKFERDERVKKEKLVSQIRTDLEAKEEELKSLRLELRDKEEELESLKVDVETKNQIIEDVERQLIEKQALLLERTEMVKSMESELDLVRKNLELKDNELNLSRSRLEEMEDKLALLSKEFEGRWKDMALTNLELTKKQKQTIAELKDELERVKQELDTKEGKIRSFEFEIERLRYETGVLNKDLDTRNRIIEELKEQLAEKQSLLMEKTGRVEELEMENERLGFIFNNMKNSISSSIIMMNKDNVVTDWNNKAEEMFGLTAEGVLGEDVFKLEFMKNEKISDAASRSQRDRKPITVRSVSIEGRNGNRFLTDVSQIPLIDSDGEFQGALMVINDVSGSIQTGFAKGYEEEDVSSLDVESNDVGRSMSLVEPLAGGGGSNKELMSRGGFDDSSAKLGSEVSVMKVVEGKVEKEEDEQYEIVVKKSESSDVDVKGNDS
jgi:PAS domain S-box-containing protein